MEESASVIEARAPLFDEHGRRIPYSGMRVHSQISRRYFSLLQPPVDFAAIRERIGRYLALLHAAPSASQFAETCGAILDGLRADNALANLANAVHVPFLCPPSPTGVPRAEELVDLLAAVGNSYVERFPESDFLNLCPGKPDASAVWAAGSRYEQFLEAREGRPVVGIYFPNCLAEYDLASQRKQMYTLPATVACGAGTAAIVLSGAVEAAVALVGSPELLWNEDNYPHHLCLSAIEEPEDQIVYTFEAYGQNLRFRHRSNMLTPEVTQLSEQWAGGLTVFAV
jgi:hypothetical protein